MCLEIVKCVMRERGRENRPIVFFNILRKHDHRTRRRKKIVCANVIMLTECKQLKLMCILNAKAVEYSMDS